MPPNYLTAAQVAEQLDCGLTNVRLQRSKGHFPGAIFATQPERGWLYPRHEVEAYRKKKKSKGGRPRKIES